MRTKFRYTLKDTILFKKKLLIWAQDSDDVVYLESNKKENQNTTFDAIVAIKAFTALKINSGNALEELEKYNKNTNDWLFGWISYDVKNEIELLKSQNMDNLQFPKVYFFQPKKIFLFKENIVSCLYLNFVADEIEDDIRNIQSKKIKKYKSNEEIEIQAKLTKEQYLDQVKRAKKYIQKGDIYEMNFCQEFFIENHELDTLSTFNKLNTISQPPFATYLKHEELFVIGASPERFLQKNGSTIITQPIKGTARRDVDKIRDDNLKTTLRDDPKERSENIMIVDLVRNDLSKIATKNSVTVEELCKTYTYKQVHHLVSTVSAKIKEEDGLKEIFKATFPMGSMTGAPKISAMQIIEELESTKRGLYSGCIGYITPEFNFDFNVVIRSILHNKKNKYTSCMVGSAITNQSIPSKEYEECLVKVNALFEVLS